MKVDRLVSIIMILLDKKRIGAQELADMFEVSPRTIYRDIDAINMAGVPICSISGVGGGFEIMQKYKIDKKVFSTADLSAILMGLSSLSDMMRGDELVNALAKVRSFIPADRAKDVELKANQVLIDVSPWMGNRNIQPYLEIIKTALEENRLLSFEYIDRYGNRTTRTTEPYQLVLKGSHWYFQGYCLKRNDFRLFKLNRINRLSCMEEAYTPRERPSFQAGLGYFKGASIHAVAIVDPQMKWRLIEEFGVDCFCEREDGQLLFQFDFVDKQNLIGWVFSFGDRIELMEPVSIRDEIIDLSKKILSRYEKHDT